MGSVDHGRDVWQRDEDEYEWVEDATRIPAPMRLSPFEELRAEGEAWERLRKPPRWMQAAPPVGTPEWADYMRWRQEPYREPVAPPERGTPAYSRGCWVRRPPRTYTPPAKRREQVASTESAPPPARGRREDVSLADLAATVAAFVQEHDGRMPAKWELANHAGCDVRTITRRMKGVRQRRGLTKFQYHEFLSYCREIVSCS